MSGVVCQTHTIREGVSKMFGDERLFVDCEDAFVAIMDARPLGFIEVPPWVYDVVYIDPIELPEFTVRAA